MSYQRKISPESRPELFSYGSNDLGARQIFEERIKYNTYVFPDFLASNFIQTWTTDRFYGLVNHKGNAVLPQLTRLKSLQFVADGSQNLYAIDFVADAWYDFCRRVRKLADENIIFRNSPWAKPFVVKAWEPLDEDYDKYMREEVYPTFFNDFTDFAGRNQKIKNIDSFIDQLDSYFDTVISKVGPITLSGLIEGSYAPMYSSGLVIEIANADYDDDFNKAYEFGDRNFTLIASIAAQYGFSIDKNIPWRFVADLRNPAMVEYMLGVPIEGFVIDENIEYLCDPLVGDVELPPMAFGFSQIPGLEDVIRHIAFYQYIDADGNKQNEPGYKRYKILQGNTWEPTFNRTDATDTFAALYETDYSETWQNDMTLLQRYFLQFYNFYVTARPTAVTLREPPPDSNCGPISQTVMRETITEEQFNDLYGNRWKLKTFYVLRKRERQETIPPKRQAYQLQQIFNNYNLTKQLADDTVAYQRTLRLLQEDFIGPADTDPLTLETVGDIIRR